MRPFRKFAANLLSMLFLLSTSTWVLGEIANHHSAPLQPRIASGTHHFKIDFAGNKRRYVLHVPPRLSNKDYPLVIALHGGGGHAEHMADDAHYGLISQANASGFALVFPNGYSKLPRGRLATWNAGDCCASARDSRSNDVGFIRAVVKDVKSHIAIDTRRIFATGMSNGGMMAYRLACEAADLVSAIAAVAGTEALNTCQPSRPVPILHIHAKDDTHVLFHGGAGPDAFRDKSKVMDFISVPETIARWVARNRCTSRATRILERPNAYCERYDACAEASRVQLCVTETGGHSWPGGGQTRLGKAAPSKALDANGIIWEFFQSSSQAMATVDP